MSDEADKGTAHKLTISQRILASLPNLQPKARPSSRPAADDEERRASTGAGNGRGGGTSGRGRSANGSAGAGRADEEGEESGASDAPDAADSPAKADKPAPRRGASGKSKEELTHAIKRIDERERVLAMTSAPIGVAVGSLLTYLAVRYNPAVGQKGHLTLTTIVLFEGGARILLSGIVLLAAYSRRRSFVGFALLFLGTSLGLPFALPFWGLGAWLIWRVFKYQKELTALGGGPARGRPAAGTRGSGRAGAKTETKPTRPRTLGEARAAGAARGRRRKQVEPVGPPPSKRYTPPKPARPKPPPPS